MSVFVPKGVGVLTLLLALPRSHLLDLQPPQGPRAPHHALVVVRHPVVPAHRLPFRGAVFGAGEQLGSPGAGVHPAHAVHVVEDALAGICTERRRRRKAGGQACSNPSQGGASKKPPQPPSTPGCPPWGSGCSYPTNQEHPGCHQPRHASHSHPVALLGAEQSISALQPAQKPFHTFPRGQTGPGTFPGDLTAFLTSCF